MKKTISLAVVTMFLFAASAVAQPPRGPQGPQGPAPEKCCKCCKCDSCMCAMENGKPEMPNPFAGIDLTKEQQEKIDALIKKCGKPEGEAPEACPENDPRKQQLESIKEILTPDQYVTYLENMLLGQQAPMQRQGKGKLKGLPHGHGPQINPAATQENDK